MMKNIKNVKEENYDGAFGAYTKYLMPTYSPEIMLVKGRGAYLWDSTGKKYLDFGSGISVCSLGHCHPAVAAAISRQAKKLVHVSNLYMNDKQVLLAEKLIEKGFTDGKVFFCNSGAEANEGAIKLARKYGSPSGRFKIITMENSFHGRTLATLAATGRSKYREGFAPDTPGFVSVPFNDIDAVVNAYDEKTCAVMLEPVQGEGGIIEADPDYINSVRKFCDEKNILLIFDEVQCGMGRLGSFYAFQQYGVQPDIITLAKALGNGFPIGALLAKNRFAAILGSGTHASTFGGNPLACAAALATIETFDKELVLENCRKQSEYLFNGLKEISSPLVKGMRGRGLMIGIAVDANTAKIKTECMKRGLLILSAGENVIRLLPPLIINEKDADTALSVIKEVLQHHIEK
jgi:predicted acetylornithine/succinylornithine family transaminase